VIAPELADPVGAFEVGEHQDVEQLGAGSGTCMDTGDPGRVLNHVVRVGAS
jgi:hypothetical protein